MKVIKGIKKPSPASVSADAEQRSQKFDRLKANVVDAQRKVQRFIEDCDHIIFQKADPTWAWEHNPEGLSGARCLICKKSFGWACPDAPDGVCHYTDDIEDGEILLLDKKWVKPPNLDVCCYDECLFCGHPEERK